MPRAKRTFRIELRDRHGWAAEVLAVIRDERLARATFDAALNQRPSHKIRLRTGPRIVVETE
jgi:hypothetical protein